MSSADSAQPARTLQGSRPRTRDRDGRETVQQANPLAFTMFGRLVAASRSRAGNGWFGNSGSMTFVRQILAVALATALVWTGSAGAVHAHAHEAVTAQGAALHEMMEHADLEHGSALFGHDHDRDQTQNQDDGQPDHEKGVFHVHILSFVALETEYPSFANAAESQSILTPLRAMPLNTRSIMPADRPPRTFL